MKSVVPDSAADEEGTIQKGQAFCYIDITVPSY